MITHSQNENQKEGNDLSEKEVTERGEGSLTSRSVEHAWTEVSPNKSGRLGDLKSVSEERITNSSISITPSRFSILNEVEGGEIPVDSHPTKEVKEISNEKDFVEQSGRQYLPRANKRANKNSASQSTTTRKKIYLQPKRVKRRTIRTLINFGFLFEYSRFQ